MTVFTPSILSQLPVFKKNLQGWPKVQQICIYSIPSMPTYFGT